MTARAALCLLPFALAAPALRAEPVYIVEQLVVSVTSDPGGEGERVGQVKSADKVELLEREGEESHIRLPNGKEGWIKSSYLSTEEPLQQRLGERTAELDKLRQDSDKLRQDMSRMQSELVAARAAHTTPAPAPATASPAPAAPPPPAPPPTANTVPAPAAVSDALSGSSTPVRETVFLREPERRGQTPWALLLGVSAVMLLAGFALGWQTLDRRIRRRYGGLKIY